MSHGDSLVLITGATGHIGFRALLDLLTLGYKVRAAVRSEAKANTILNNPLFKKSKFPSELLSFVVVPDLEQPHAYDEAVKGVNYVIHIASPITTGGEFTQEQYKAYFIAPAVKGALGMLEAAATSSSVKRVVITSSVVAQIEFGIFAGGMSEDQVFNSESRTPNDEGPYANEFQAYSASKTQSLNEVESWMATKKPSFDLVTIHPSFVEGRDDLALTAQSTITGTNAVLLGSALGKTAPHPMPGATVHNEDVARLHVEALRPDIPAGSYVAHSNTPAGTFTGTRWEETNQIIARLFPDAVKKGLFPNNGVQQSSPVHIDASKTEKAFGWKFQSYEKQVESVIGHYLELLPEA
jgi:nucleoside-diphosphate-sugar epimerase